MLTKIIVQIGAGKFKGQRATKLSPNDEYNRMKLLWQPFDRAQWVANFGAGVELAAVMAHPATWKANVQRAVWIF